MWSRYDDPLAQSIVAHRQKKKAKLDTDTTGSPRQDSVTSETLTSGTVDITVTSNLTPAHPNGPADSDTRTS